jgi:CBS domain-containing protein
MPGGEIRLRDVMTPVVTCVTPDLGLDELRELLLAEGISGVPVIDEEGRPIGVVSKTDLVGLGPGAAIVADVMMPVAFTLRDTDTLQRAALLMATENIHRLPLVDEHRKVSGIITTFDLARWVAHS